MQSTRTLSYSEISTAYTCQAQWDFSYGGRLAGSTLKPKHVAKILQGGSAWGAMVAAWHANSGTLLARLEALNAMRASLDADQKKMVDAGVILEGVLDQRMALEALLSETFGHYTSLCDPLPNLTRLEGELDVALPSRGGRRASSRYHFQGFLDGFTVDRRGEWLWECKFRGPGKLTPRWLIELGPQYLQYAWARQRETGRPIVGLILEERISAAPKPAKIVFAKRKGEGIEGEDGRWRTVSHDADQLTTPERYLAACEEYGADPKPETLAALEGRVWQQRVYVPFRPSELEEAGRGLVSAAKLIRDLDSGELHPVRNAKAITCKSCRFRTICKNPRDDLLVDQLFSRGTPKRDKPPRDKVAAGAQGDGDSGLDSRFDSEAPSPAPSQPLEEVPF